MQKFAYSAKRGPGPAVHGEVVAEDRASAVARLDAMGLSPVWVREAEGDDAAARRAPARGVRQRDVSVFTRQLASLTRGAVPILKALATVAAQTENRRFRRVVENILGQVRDGRPLSDALALYSAVFPERYVSMVRAGEAGGLLDEMLLRIADAREREEETRRKVRAALAYPILVVTVGVATVFVMLTFFMPKISALFVRFHGRLPLPTRVLIALSDFLSQRWFWIVPPLLLLAGVAHRLLSTGSGRAAFDRLKLRLPIARRIVLQSEIARCARTLGLLIQAGIPIDRALALSAGALTNSAIRAAVENARQNTVRYGMSVTDGFRQSRLIPPFAINMMAVGEETGRLDEALFDVAAFYEKEVEAQTRLIASLVEPLLILCVGGVVGFIVFAMLLPLFEIGRIL